VYVVCVRVQVLPDQAESFIAATRANAAGTRLEPGNLRFDVLRHLSEPDRFFIYEVYRDEDGFKAHQRSEHYLRWREEVAPMMAVPRVGDRYAPVFPDLWP
jgi:autoinducer 2-degrading protein